MIVKEIEQWRRSKLLPDQYCDFLLNLYADPDEVRPASPAASHAIGKAFHTVQQATGKQWLLTFGTFTLISFVVLYFSRFHPALQIGLLSLFVLLLLWVGERFRKRNEWSGLLVSSCGMLLMLCGGLYTLHLHGLQEWGWTIGLLGFCSLFWIVYGMKRKMPVLHLCGWLAMLLVYGFLLTRYTADPKWYEIQLYWIPLAMLFGWASWFVHRWSKGISAILFLICAISWLAPECYSLLALGNMQWIQMQLLIKFVIGGGTLFLLRKQWTVWVV